MNRSPLSDEELENLTADAFAKVKLTEDEKHRLRLINERRSQERERNAAEWRNAEQPLVEELHDAGFHIESVWDLFNRKEPWNKNERISPYPEALPILLNHMERAYPDRVREGIARALAVRRAGWDAAPRVDFMAAWRKLIKLYCDEDATTGAKHGLAVAISEMAEDAVMNDVIELVKDVRHGSSRVILLGALERSSGARGKLMSLGADPELQKEVQAILRRLK